MVSVVLQDWLGLPSVPGAEAPGYCQTVPPGLGARSRSTGALTAQPLV